MIAEFRNTALLDFTEPANKQAMAMALRHVESQFSREYGLLIGGKEVKTGNLHKSFNPCERNQVVATFHRAGKKEVDLA